MRTVIKNEREATFAQRLKQIMDDQNLTQIDILNKCKPYCDKYNTNISKGTLSLYVSGQREPRQDRLFILSLALGVSEAWLMGYPVDKDKTKVGLSLQDNSKHPLYDKIIVKDNISMTEQLAFLDVDESIIIKEYRQHDDKIKRLLFGLFMSAMQSVDINEIKKATDMLRHSQKDTQEFNRVQPNYLSISKNNDTPEIKQITFEEFEKQLEKSKPKVIIANKRSRTNKTIQTNKKKEGLA